MLEKHLDGILAYCDKKVSLGYIESTNLKEPIAKLDFRRKLRPRKVQS